MDIESNELEARLRDYYAKYNPNNDQNIAEIVRKYRGKVATLCAKLQKKYGVAPDLTTPSAPCKSPKSLDQNTTDTTTQKLKDVKLVYDPSYSVYTAPPSSGGPLDFRSNEFDPLAALQSTSLQPLIPTVYALDNIHKCRHLLPAKDPNYQPIVHIVKKATVSSSKDRNQSSTPPTVPPLFETLADTYLNGPFTVLRRCFLEHKRIRVVIRRINSIRGTCSGFLKAFDKHMNLVLMDVSVVEIPWVIHQRREVEQQLDDQQSVEPFSIANPRRNRHITSQGFVKQLFIRGDNVVMVMEQTQRGK